MGGLHARLVGGNRQAKGLSLQLSETETFAIHFGISSFCGHSGSQLPQLVQLLARCDSVSKTLKRNFALIRSLCV
jgi:hypothetical protein